MLIIKRVVTEFHIVGLELKNTVIVRVKQILYTKWKMLVSGTHFCCNGVLCALCAPVGSSSLCNEFNLAR